MIRLETDSHFADFAPEPSGEDGYLFLDRPEDRPPPGTIRRERNANLINRITNDPAVLPFISRHGGEIDWLQAVRLCVILSNGVDAAAVFEQVSERDWQINTIFAPTCRGRRALEAGKAMREWMMPAHADMIFGSIPNGFRHAIWFYRQLGGKQVEQVESAGQIWRAQPDETLFEMRSA